MIGMMADRGGMHMGRFPRLSQVRSQLLAGGVAVERCLGRWASPR